MAFVSGCPKAGQSTTSGESAAPAEATAAPKGDTARFEAALVRETIAYWTAAPDGAAVTYDALNFATDGQFAATATQRFGGGEEDFQCEESGSWSLDGGAAESATSAAMTMEVTSTTCAGREAPITIRVQATILDGQANLVHR